MRVHLLNMSRVARLYVYFCTSKVSKLSTERAQVRVHLLNMSRVAHHHFDYKKDGHSVLFTQFTCFCENKSTSTGTPADDSLRASLYSYKSTHADT